MGHRSSIVNWESLENVAKRGARAYNEGAGPSFLVLDGVCHTEFHARFLGYSIEACFDPFMLVRGSSGKTNPVISHESLSNASRTNTVSHGMRMILMDIAHQRFWHLLDDDIKDTSSSSSENLLAIIRACSESIPLEMLKKVALELADFP